MRKSLSIVKNEFSLLRSLDRLATETLVSEIMVRDIKTLREKESVQKAIDVMADYSISGLIIVNEIGYPIGIVSEGDIIKKVFHKAKNPKKILIKEIMTSHLFTITSSWSIGETVSLMRKHEISKLPVVEKERLIGYVTKADLLERLNEIYYQNARLKWLPIIIMVLLIIIAIILVVYAQLFVAYLSK